VAGVAAAIGGLAHAVGEEGGDSIEDEEEDKDNDNLGEAVAHHNDDVLVPVELNVFEDVLGSGVLCDVVNVVREWCDGLDKAAGDIQRKTRFL
jgi:hypothetical protein